MIPRIGEFVDTLFSLLRGNVLVVADAGMVHAVIDGNIVYHSLQPLAKFKLVEEYENLAGFENTVYLRLTEHGRTFAERACASWLALPWYERLAIRFLR